MAHVDRWSFISDVYPSVCLCVPVLYNSHCYETLLDHHQQSFKSQHVSSTTQHNRLCRDHFLPPIVTQTQTHRTANIQNIRENIFLIAFGRRLAMSLCHIEKSHANKLAIVGRERRGVRASKIHRFSREKVRHLSPVAQRTCVERAARVATEGE
jgi:hypothetical protein